MVNFWEYLGDPPHYIEDKETNAKKKGDEKKLEESIETLIRKENTIPEMGPYINPYDNPNPPVPNNPLPDNPNP